MKRRVFRYDNHFGRLDVVRAVIQGLHKTADSLLHANRSNQGCHIANGPVSGFLMFQRLKSGFLMTSLSAQCTSDNFWEPDNFGLKGLDSTILTLHIPGFKQGLTGSMTELFWSRPFFPRSLRHVPPKTQFFLWREKNGSYGILLPLACGDAVSTLRGSPHGLEVAVSTGMEGLHRMEAPLFVTGFGRDPYILTRNAYRAAARATNRSDVLRENKLYPEPFEYLGWCTWDAFYRRVNARGILAKIEEFRKKGIQPGFVLIDDGWYPMKDARLVDTRTDRRKFPGGLLPLIRRIKQHYSVPFVGAWHCHTGYWMGAHPKHHLPFPEKETLEGDPAGYYFPSLGQKGARTFFTAWHRRMKRDGVDFVKVDGQGSIDRFCPNRLPFTRAAENTEGALQDSCDIHFKGRLLNCMSMGHDLIWTWDRSNLTRSSNDFLPRKKGSFKDHAIWNAYNSLWFSQVTWCDWDMWWTKHDDAAFHMALRAVSGGPVYVSDRIGRTNPRFVKPLCLSNARLLRCDEVGIPTEDCLFVDVRKQPKPLKIMNIAGNSGILGIFNVSDWSSINASIKPSDIRGLSGNEFAVWCWNTGEGRIMRRDDAWVFKVKYGGSRVLTFVPIRYGFASIGLIDKIVSPKTITRVIRKPDKIDVVLKEGGRFVAFCAKTPISIRQKGRFLPYTWHRGWLRFQVPIFKKHLKSINTTISIHLAT